MEPPHVVEALPAIFKVAPPNRTCPAPARDPIVFVLSTQVQCAQNGNGAGVANKLGAGETHGPGNRHVVEIGYIGATQQGSSVEDHRPVIVAVNAVVDPVAGHVQFRCRRFHLSPYFDSVKRTGAGASESGDAIEQHRPIVVAEDAAVDPVPAIGMVPVGAINAPWIVTLLKADTVVPPTAVVPLKIVAPPL